ncbi:MAG: hypothetical protein N2554_05760, partial [Fimbriimonadales bacterium]|nr:hypothetical protein [Fimbriimonadales bacterium]
MRKLVRVGIVVGFALAGIGLLWFAGTRRSGEPALEPLMLERKRMGVLPRPPQLRGGEDYWEYTRATLADLDADGVPELLALGEVLAHNALKPSGTVWLSLKDGATSTTPLLPLMPSVTNTSGYYSRHATVPPNSLPLARE